MKMIVPFMTEVVEELTIHSIRQIKNKKRVPLFLARLLSLVDNACKGKRLVIHASYFIHSLRFTIDIYILEVMAVYVFIEALHGSVL